jgi:hypothetical protein
MVARARRVAGFGSGVKGWRVGVAVVRGPGAASAHRCLLASRTSSETRRNIYCYTQVCSRFTPCLALEWHASSEMLRD